MLLVTNTFRPLLNGELSVENVLCFLRGEMNIDVPNQLSNIHHARKQTCTCQKTNILYTCQKTNIHHARKQTTCSKQTHMHYACLPGSVHQSRSTCVFSIKYEENVAYLISYWIFNSNNPNSS